jgi:hypothetical protein
MKKTSDMSLHEYDLGDTMIVYGILLRDTFKSQRLIMDHGANKVTVETN